MLPGNSSSASSRYLQEKKYDFPFWVVCVYFIFEYARPHEQYGIIGVLKIPALTIVLSILLWLGKADKSVLKEQAVRVHLAIIAFAGFTVLFSYNTYFAYKAAETLFMFFAAGVLPLVAFVNNRHRLRLFIDIWVAVHVYLAVNSILHGGTGPGSFLKDENDLALALNMSLPYAYFLATLKNNSTIKKIFYLVAVVVILLGVVNTSSRGGFLGLVAVLAMIIVFSQHKIKNLFLVVMIGLVAYLFVPAKYFDEVRSIGDDDDSTRNERIYSWGLGWDMFLDNPILGVGANNYPWRVHEYELKSKEDVKRFHGGRAAHSLYFTLMPELGLVGIILFFMLLGSDAKNAKTAFSLSKSDEEVGWEFAYYHQLGRAVLASMIAYLVAGAFISVLYYPHMWYLTGFALMVKLVAVKHYNEIKAQSELDDQQESPDAQTFFKD